MSKVELIRIYLLFIYLLFITMATIYDIIYVVIKWLMGTTWDKSDTQTVEGVKGTNGDIRATQAEPMVPWSDTVMLSQLMKLMGSDCTHLYGSQARQLMDANIIKIANTWKKGVC